MASKGKKTNQYLELTQSEKILNQRYMNLDMEKRMISVSITKWHWVEQHGNTIFGQQSQFN